MRSTSNFPHVGGIAETDLALGGMHIHIHGSGVHVDEEERDRVLALHQRGVIALAQREIDRGVFHRPPVDENELLRPRSSGSRPACR